ncbi:MAG: glycosyltransferase [Actinomycetota bacterium]|nr:glycosyltransferase [Actinomycetota bacterium]
MNILEINTTDMFGGAEQVAVDLLNKYLEKGLEAKLAVRFKHADYREIYELDVFDRSTLAGGFFHYLNKAVSRMPHFRGKNALQESLSLLSCPSRLLDRIKGIEDFNYPPYYGIPSLPWWKADIIHCHNLHRNYFNLRSLERISPEIPVMLTLHDTWTFTGHCTYFVDCELWETGCARCPHLERYVPIRKDRAGTNWETKKRTYDNSNLYVATPSKWLMNCVDRSILRASEKRVIPNGVDTRVFKNGNRAEARKSLGLPPHHFIVLHVSAAGRARSEFKDYATIESALEHVKSRLRGEDVLFVCIGGSEGEELRRGNEIFLPRISDRSKLAAYYNASNVFLHAANAENLPLTVLEAQACGIPAIVTEVGGVPEIIQDGVTGFLVPRGDSEAMAATVIEMLNNRELRRKVGMDAAREVLRSYTLDLQADRYISWYRDIINSFVPVSGS